MEVLGTLCRGIGEPTVVAMLLLLPVALWLRVQSRFRDAVTIWGIVICMMLGWRAGIQIISSRYAAALILPWLFIVVMLARYVQKEWKWPFVQRRQYLIPLVIITALLGFYAGKLARVNTYRNYLPEGCAVIRQHAAAFKAPLLLVIGEQDRVGYYSGMPVLPLANCPADRDMAAYLAEQAGSYSGCADVVLVGLRTYSGVLQKLEKAGGRIIYRQFTDNRRNKEFAVIAYENMPLYMGETAAAMPAEKPEQILWSDGFEKSEPNDPDNLHNRLRIGKRLFFFRDPDLIMPVDWRPFVYYRPIYMTESQAEFELIPEAISGKYSLRMKSARCIMLEHAAYLHVPARSCSVRVRGTPGSRFALIINRYEKWSHTGVWAERNFRVPDDQLRTYTLPLNGLPADYKVGIVLHHGEIIVDDVVLK